MIVMGSAPDPVSNPITIMARAMTPQRQAATVTSVVRYRFLDPMGDVLEEREFDDHAAALAAARDDPDWEDEVQRVEYLGPQGDWRWAGPVEG